VGVARTDACATRKRQRRARGPRSRTREDGNVDKDVDEYKDGQEDAHAHG
jgi:hypothetical protein